jgi:hypothetical protein
VSHLKMLHGGVDVSDAGSLHRRALGKGWRVAVR